MTNPLSPIQTAAATKASVVNYCFPYVRVSSERQTDSGLSVESQSRILREYYDRAIAPKGVLWHGDYWEDDQDLAAEGISASKVNFCDRPIGGEINRRARRGDHVIVSKVDRIFRGWADCANTVEMWEKRGVICHVVELGLSNENPQMAFVFDMVLSIQSRLAKEEAKRISDRTKAAFGSLRAHGCTNNGKWAQIGFKYHRVKVGKTMRLAIIPDNHQRRLMNRFIELWKDHTHNEALAILKAEGWKWPKSYVKGKKRGGIGELVYELKPISIDNIISMAHFLCTKHPSIAWPDEFKDGKWIIREGGFRVEMDGTIRERMAQNRLTAQ